ncbi:MAG: hypothetical protein M5F18_04080 [Asgard group archaeon]|nr:hypothetical protein [Asgard group archaeon]
MIVVVVDGGGLTANETELEIFVRFARTFFLSSLVERNRRKQNTTRKKKFSMAG